MDCELWLISFSALVFHTVTIVSSCTGHSELICSPQPITVLAGDDVILPCCLESAISATSGRVEWTKPGLDPEYVHVHRDGRLQYQIQNPSYYYRTGLFVSELRNGNVSMKISEVKISDKGTYKCFLPSEQQEAFVQLNVGSVSSPVVTMTNSTTSGVMLDCECAGWYPEPEVLWLDAEGNLLSAGPTETVRGPDDLYTVSSRLTVEKRHSNSFTCRVQQKDIHQTRETQIHVPDDFFKTLSSPNPSVRIIIIIIGSVVGIMFIAVAFLMWKRGPKIIKTKINQPADDERRKQENPELQSLAEGETEKPGTQNQSANTEMHLDTGEVKKKKKTVQRRLFTAEGERN